MKPTIRAREYGLSEFRIFKSWALTPQNIFASCLFVLKKIRQQILERALSKRPYGFRYYPGELKTACKKVCLPERAEFENHADKPQNFGNISQIKLASQYLGCVDGNIDWKRNSFEDSEDLEALHRWIWAWDILEKNPDSVQWIFKQCELWTDLFLHEASSRACDVGDTRFRWESYTVSERIANMVLLSTIFQVPLSSKLESALMVFVKFLLPRCEFYKTLTGNHVINNARALMLAGSYLKHSSLCEFAKTLLTKELPRLLDQDGFLKEGSSHYQLLFTRWLWDIEKFSKQDFKEIISPFSIATQNASSFFILPNNRIPLIGDVSPDITPKLLLNLPTDFYQGMWKKNIVLGLKVTEHFGRFFSNQHSLFFRRETKGPSRQAGHQHCDALSFVYFHEGVEVFADPGRLNYASLYGKSHRNHNTILINGQGDVVESQYRYPATYGSAERTYETALQPNFSLKITSNGFARIGVPQVLRTLELSENTLEIEDEISNPSQKSLVEILWHFGAGIHLTSSAKNTWALEFQGKQASLCVVSENQTLQCDLFQGGTKQEGPGVLHPSYGEHVASTSCVVRCVISETTKIRTILTLQK